MGGFDNSYARLPSRFYRQIFPEKFETPTVVTFNDDLAEELGLHKVVEVQERVLVFSGQKILPGSQPIALAYAGHQFGHFVPSLGDGRAHLLGELHGFDIQLKGAGKTTFSRNADGRSALGPVLREYIVSEAMHNLGVPTTRALCAVQTGEFIQRQEGMEPGGILTRVAKSHLRVGTFAYFAYRQDLEALEILLSYTIDRHYFGGRALGSNKEKALYLLQQICENQSDLIAKWSGLGFIHGVMNTDNFSLAGITLDYGPCAFMDDFSFHQVFSSIDHQGRYSFFNQVPAAQWNILRLADCLLPLIDRNQDRAIEIVEGELQAWLELFPQKRMRIFADKLGIKNFVHADEKIVLLFLNYLEKEALDFTRSFRNLPKLFSGETEGYPNTKQRSEFMKKWKDRVGTTDHLDQLNPWLIPRNHQIQKVIADAYDGKYSGFHTLTKALKNPYKVVEGYDHLSHAPLPKQRVTQTFCGT